MSLIGLALTFLAGALVGGLAMSGSALLSRRRERREPHERHVRSGLARLAASDPRGAAEALRRACEADSSDDALFVLLAEQLRLSGAAGRASDVIDVVLARRDQDPEIAAAAWLVRGRLLASAGDAQAALAAFASATEIDPKAIEPLVARGRLLSAQRRWEDAIACAEELGKLQPERGRRIAARRRVLLARELLAEGRAEAAFAEAESAVKDGSEPAAALLTQGDALFQLGRIGPAIQSWVQASRELPAIAPVVLDRLEQVSSSPERRERARRFGEDAVERAGGSAHDSWRVYAWLVADALSLGQADRARRWLERLERAAPRTATAARLRAAVDGAPHGAGSLGGVMSWDPWRCRRCGEELEEFDWRCPRCTAWASLR